MKKIKEINIVTCTNIKTRMVWVVWNNEEPMSEFSIVK